MDIRLKHFSTNFLWRCIPNSKKTQQKISNINPIIEKIHPESKYVTIEYTPNTNVQSAHPKKIETSVRYTPTEYVLLSLIFTGFNRI